MGGDGICVEVYGRDFIVDGLDGGRVHPRLVTELEFGGVSNEGFGELGAVDGEVGFFVNEGNGAFEALLAEGLYGSN